MKARAKEPYRVIRAFTGRIFVNYEWRPVPDGCEVEAKRLEDGGYLELEQSDSGHISIEYTGPLKIDATPGAKKLAKEYGVELSVIASLVDGSGKGGRITKPDVQEALSYMTFSELFDEEE